MPLQESSRNLYLYVTCNRRGPSQAPRLAMATATMPDYRSHAYPRGYSQDYYSQVLALAPTLLALEYKMEGALLQEICLGKRLFD